MNYLLIKNNEAVTGTCESSCPLGTYAEDITTRCELCNSRCIACTGPNWFDCEQCKFGFYLFITSCIEMCPDGHWNDDVSRTCRSCSGECLTCYGGTGHNCLSCSSLDSLFFYQDNCLLECPSNYYGDIIT